MPHLNEESENLIRENRAYIGIAKVDHVSSNYEKLLNYTESDLRSMSKQECIEAQYVLLQYGMSINKQINNLKSKLDNNYQIFWRAISKVYGSYDHFMGRDLIIASACNEYEYIANMHDEILKMQAILKDMDGLIERVDKIVQVFKDLSFCKVRT